MDFCWQRGLGVCKESDGNGLSDEAELAVVGLGTNALTYGAARRLIAEQAEPQIGSANAQMPRSLVYLTLLMLEASRQPRLPCSPGLLR